MKETLEEAAESKWSLEKAQEFAINKFRSKYKTGTVTWESILEVLKVGVLTGHKFGAKWQQEQDRWKTVYQETPPIHVELLAQSPEGIIHLASWRESYNIFTCQHKSESSSDWKWKTI